MLDSLAQHPEIVHRRLGMHRKSHQDGGSGKHRDNAFADLLQQMLSSVVDPAAAKVDAKPLKVRACIPVDLDDVSGQKPFSCLVSEGDQRFSAFKVQPRPSTSLLAVSASPVAAKAVVLSKMHQMSVPAAAFLASTSAMAVRYSTL
jgi:hypothetical protein